MFQTMKYRKVIFLIVPFLLAFFIGLALPSQIRGPKEGGKEIEQDNEEISLLTLLEENKVLENAIINGDTTAYEKAKNTYLSERLLPFAIVMANKYHYPKAYGDIFRISNVWMVQELPLDRLISIDNEKFVKMDSISSQPYLYFLEQGAKRGDLYCIEEYNKLAK